jgi:hypothetical protein
MVALYSGRALPVIQDNREVGVQGMRPLWPVAVILVLVGGFEMPFFVF